MIRIITTIIIMIISNNNSDDNDSNDDNNDNNKHELLPGESKKRPAFERLLLPEYISNDILQYLIK